MIFVKEETKMKISLALKGKKKPPRSEEHRRKLSEAFKGKTYVERFGKEKAMRIIEKKRRDLKGRKRPQFSDEWRKHLSESLKGREVWNKGKKGLQKAWNKINISRRLLYQKYVIGGKSSNRISKELDISRSVVIRALKEYKIYIPNRTSSDFIKNKTLEAIHGIEKAKIIRKKLSKIAKGRKIKWKDKISKGIKNYYRIHGYPYERRRERSKITSKLWKKLEYRNKLIEAHRKYLKEHPEELDRLKKIQFSKHPTKIETKVRNFLKTFWIEDKDFFFDQHDKTDKTSYRPDFQFPNKMVIIEVDGYYKHFTPEGLRRSMLRKIELENVGWKVYRFIHKDIERNFDKVKSEIIKILDQDYHHNLIFKQVT